MSKTKNHRWTEAHAREVMEHADNRRLSDVALARRMGVSPQRIHRWRKRLQAVPAEPANSSSRGFVEVKLSAPVCRPFTVHLGNGMTIDVWPGFDAAELSRLMTAMEATC